MGDERYIEQAGAVGVTHYGQMHAMVTDEPDGVDHFNLFIDPMHYPLPVLPAKLQGVLREILPLHPNFMHNLNRSVRLVLDDPASAVTWLATILHEVGTRGPGHEEVIALNFRLFLIACCRQAMKSGVQLKDIGRDPSKARLERLRLHLDATYDTHHTLKDLSKYSGLTPPYLCRAFKEYAGKRVFEYLQERRIQAAMVALRSTEDKILTIALACGFTDLAHFNRKFKKLVGTTPSAYRNHKPMLSV